MQKKNELALSELAKLVGIPLKTGWKTRLSEWFDIDLSLLSNWITRGIPKYRIKEVRKKGYPVEQWYNIPEPYRESEENMGIPKNNGRDSRSQEYTEPKNVTFVPKALFGPPHPDQEFIDAVVEILDSGEKSTINALKSNIKEFHEKIIERQAAKREKEQFEFRQQKLEKELESVKKSIASLEAGKFDGKAPENGGTNTVRSTK